MLRWLGAYLLILIFSLSANAADKCVEAMEKVHELCSSSVPDEAFEDAEAASPKDFSIVLNSFKACAAKVGTCYKECGNDTVGPGASVETLLRKLRNTYGKAPIISEIKQCRDAFKVFSDSVSGSCDGNNIGLRTVTEPTTLKLKETHDKCKLFAKMEGASDPSVNVASKPSDDKDKDSNKNKDNNNDQNKIQAASRSASPINIPGGGNARPGNFIVNKTFDNAENSVKTAGVQGVGGRARVTGRLGRVNAANSGNRGRGGAHGGQQDIRTAPVNGSLQNTGGPNGRIQERVKPNNKARRRSGKAKRENYFGGANPSARYGAVTNPNQHTYGKKNYADPSRPKVGQKINVNYDSQGAGYKENPQFGDGDAVGPIRNRAAGPSIFDITGDTFNVLREQQKVIEDEI